MRKDEIEVFSTTELTLAASLLCKGFDCNINNINPTRASFIFVNSKNLQKTVSDYWKNDILVEPKHFSNAQRDLKARIREESVK